MYDSSNRSLGLIFALIKRDSVALPRSESGCCRRGVSSVGAGVYVLEWNISTIEQLVMQLPHPLVEVLRKECKQV